MSKYYLGARAAADFQAMRAAHNAERVDKRPMRKRTVGVAGGAKVKRLRYKSMHSGGDVLVCRTWDGTTEGSEDIYVAKPYLLQESTEARTGYSYEYTDEQDRTSLKDEDSTTEDQVIVPAYVEDDELWCVKANTGITVGSESVQYIDLNIDARMWMRSAD